MKHRWHLHPDAPNVGDEIYRWNGPPMNFRGTGASGCWWVDWFPEMLFVDVFSTITTGTSSKSCSLKLSTNVPFPRYPQSPSIPLSLSKAIYFANTLLYQMVPSLYTDVLKLLSKENKRDMASFFPISHYGFDLRNTNTSSNLLPRFRHHCRNVHGTSQLSPKWIMIFNPSILGCTYKSEKNSSYTNLLTDPY